MATKEPAQLIYNWWERLLNAQSEAFGGDRELTELSNKLDDVRSGIFGDQQITGSERELLYKKMEAVAQIYARWAEKKGVPLHSDAPITRESFQIFREAAEIHFQSLAGDDNQHYRGGLLSEWIENQNAELVEERIVLDLLTSPSTAIAIDKLHLIRAQLSLLGDGKRQQHLLERIRHHLAKQLQRPVWTARGQEPAIRTEQFERNVQFESEVAARPVPLPVELRGTNRMLPNRPVAGRDSSNREAVQALLADLRTTGKLFTDQIPQSSKPVQIAVKIELNLGIEGPPSVSDPAVTYAVLRELLDVLDARGIEARFTVGDSNGIENAPVGRTSMDGMRDTGNYHAALKAALEFASRRSMPEAKRVAARASLDKLLFLEQASPSVYFGGADDSISKAADLDAAEAAAAPWVQCVDYDQTGFPATDAELGPLGQAVHGSNRFYLAEPWIAADYRVHVTRGVSTHLFAGWTGGLKGLVGLHALGGRPADLGMRRRGESPLDILIAILHTGSFTGMFASRANVPDFAAIAASCHDLQCQTAIRESTQDWTGLSQFSRGRAVWTEGATAVDAELRRDRDAGLGDMEIMAKMRRQMAALVTQAEQASPGFRASLRQGVAGGTRAFLLTMWRMREHLPQEMRDESMGLRIGLLSQLPYQADLVVQGLPKIGLGGGPDAYFDVRDAGIVVAGIDEISVDLTAIREARIDGNPWSFNHPIHGALQFGRGPMCWEEIRNVSGRGARTVRA